jgi:Na+/H+-dicarboxylate symporters
MYYGRFFEIDFDHSNIKKGIVVFRYVLDDNLTMTLSSGDVVFFQKPSKNEEGRSAATNVVLCIPFDENLDEDLNSTLAEVVNKSIRQTQTISDEPIVSYFSTFRFENPKNKKKKATEEQTKEIPVRKLVLDFLFDLHENRIFQMSPHYRQAIEKLRANFFSRCLVAKARYYYQRNLYPTLSKRRNTKSRKENVKRQNFYGEFYLKAEEEWTQCIRDERSDKLFRDSNGWFEPSEDEMKHVYWPCLRVELTEAVREKKKENDLLNSKWFLRRFSGTFPWKVYLSGNHAFFGWHLFLPRLFISITVAWFTLLLMGEVTVNEFTKDPGIIFLGLIFWLVFLCAWMSIRRVNPLAKDIFRRTMNFTLTAFAFSFIIGLVLLDVFDCSPNNEIGFSFLITLSTFVGTVIQHFLYGIDFSDPL